MNSTTKMVSIGVLALVVGVGLGFSVGNTSQSSLQGALMGGGPRPTTVASESSVPTETQTSSAPYAFEEPCIMEDGTLSTFDPRQYGIEVAHAQADKPTNPPPCPAPPPTNKSCGGSPTAGDICTGKCIEPGEWCQLGTNSEGGKTCSCKPTTDDSQKCGAGGNDCGGKCDPMQTTEGSIKTTCAMVLVGNKKWCQCQPNLTLPCKFISGVCPVGGLCDRSGQVCRLSDDKKSCGCVDDTK